MGRAGVFRFSLFGASSLGLVIAFSSACGSGRGSGFDDEAQDAAASDLDGGGTFNPDPFGEGGANPQLPEGETRDPVNCEEAKNSKSYVGCDYWPTVTANIVWSIFDFAAVVANTGTQEAEITVTGPSNTNKKVKVPAGELKKIYLPWVPELKGTDTNECGQAVSFNASVLAQSGAFHLVSTTPVIVYQFNALEYKGAGGENPDGTAKDWATCPGTAQKCQQPGAPPQSIGCFSFSNDASLLLPSTAMTNNYRVIGQHGWSEQQGLFGGETAILGPTLTITATQPQTEVTVTLSQTAKVLAGGPIAATNGGGTIKFTLANAGDVVELAGDKGKNVDFSGSLVQGNKPLQVISALPCINLPQGKGSCDHVEESVLPAETLGKHYAVVPPTGAKTGQAVKHNVRFYGNKDGTTLTYQPSKPAGCPATLKAGEVVDCGLVTEAFDVTGNNEFAVSTFLLGVAELYPGGLLSPPSDLRGDPSGSIYAAIEQFRTKYVFLAPDDYSVSFADITGTEDADITLDGQPVKTTWEKIGNTGLGVYRVKLGAGQGGAHVLTSKKPVGVQVLGYGDNTSYQYPAGLNLKLLAPPPPPPK